MQTVDLDEAQVVLTTVLGFFDPGAKGTAQTHWSHMTGWLKTVDKTCWSKFAQAIATAWRWQDRMGLFVFSLWFGSWGDGSVIERIHDDGEEYGISPKAGDELQINYELVLKST